MPRLWKRIGRLTVGEQRFEGIDFRFTVTKTLDREPNTAEVEVYGLSRSTRRSIEEVDGQPVRIEAGYDNDTGVHVIFQGQLRKGFSSRQGPEIATTIEAADGERAHRSSRINRSFGSGTNLVSVIRSVGESMGVGIGNLVERIGTSGFEGLGNVFEEGVVVSGPSHRELGGLLNGAGLEYSIQDGNLQLLEAGQPLTNLSVRLSSDTGLIESPSVDTEGVLKAKSLIMPQLNPGAKVHIDSDFVNGFFRITKSTYTGDTKGNEWFVDMEGKRL